jgi:HEAT repeat protein
MQTNFLDTTNARPLVAAAAAGLAAASHAAPPPSTDELVVRLRSRDDAIRGPAWQGAAPYGAAAVKPLASVMSDHDFETARSATRALWVIVRHAGRPGAAREAAAVARELTALLPDHPTPVRREVLWMLSEIAGDDAIAAMASLLSDSEVRSDALCALMRLPGRKSTGAIRTAVAAAPEEFKFALADALRKRGETVRGHPSQKLEPSRQTHVVYTPPPS